MLWIKRRILIKCDPVSFEFMKKSNCIEGMFKIFIQLTRNSEQENTIYVFLCEVTCGRNLCWLCQLCCGSCII